MEKTDYVFRRKNAFRLFLSKLIPKYSSLMRPLILLSNDDGYQAQGINALIESLRPLADLLVVAPDGPRSGNSGAITSLLPLYNRLVSCSEATDTLGSVEVYACSGTPVDCVKMAFNILLPRLGRTPALVASGINHGDNSSVNNFYSGTMGAASEAALQGVPAVGFSLCNEHAHADFSPCAPYIAEIVAKVLREGLPTFSTLNVNFPNTPEYRGVRVCRMARSRWIKEVAESLRPNSQKPHYWLTGEPLELEPEATDTDRWALAHGYVAVTPQTLDVTHYGLLKDWKLDGAEG